MTAGPATPGGLRRALAGGVLVCDGAMGTMLHAAGNSLDQALPALNLTDPTLVRTIHDSYVDAGVDILQTNSFGASRLRLGDHGLGERTVEINQAAVRIAREAAAVRPSILVAGSVAPAVSVRQRRRVGPSDRVDALREQVAALVEAGVDLILLETFGYLDELVEAVAVATDVAAVTAGPVHDAARRPVPVVAQATFGTDAHTLSGHSPRDVAAALAGTPIVAMGTNCTLGPQRSLAVVRELRAHTDLPLTVQPNAGLPRRVGPARFEYDIDSEYFVRYARQLLDAGVAAVGGCCGTTPGQLAAVVHAVREHRARAGTAPATARERRAVTSTFTGPGDTVIVEITPDLSGGVDEALALAAGLPEAGVTTVSVAAGRTTRAQVGTIDLALHLHQQLGLDTMASVTTWDRTIMALQADLLGAHALGLRRVVCETGSPPLLGDYPHVDGIWDVDSVGLVELLAGLNDGTDYYGLRLPATTSFEIGARINPGAHDQARAVSRARAKIAAGAHFLLTRPLYEAAALERLLETLDPHPPVLVTIRPLTSFAEAEYLAHEVPDVTIPRATLAAMERAGPHAPRTGLDLAADLVTHLRPLAAALVIAGPTPLPTLHHVTPHVVQHSRHPAS